MRSRESSNQSSTISQMYFQFPKFYIIYYTQRTSSATYVHHRDYASKYKPIYMPLFGESTCIKTQIQVNLKVYVKFLFALYVKKNPKTQERNGIAKPSRILTKTKKKEYLFAFRPCWTGMSRSSRDSLHNTVSVYIS